MFKKLISIIIVMAFFLNALGPVPEARADALLNLPAPGMLMHLSPSFAPAYLKGIVIHPENALKFDFIIYKGDQALSDSQKRNEYMKLIKYFMASLAVPDEDQWVNLSPYEKNRIIKEDFGKTEMGRDLLAQDYILKQITASLIYPQSHLGQEFWKRVYAKAQEKYGTTNLAVNTFNKVWIVPDNAVIYEKGNMAYVVKNHLKVMLEEDYLSLQKHSAIDTNTVISKHSLASKIVREIVLPVLEKEVNEGKNFASLRQVYSGMLLAAWYKRALRESLLSKIYANKSKLKGVDQDPKINEVIYQQYLKAYKKGVFNFIKEDVDKYTNETIPRKYFSGGALSYNDPTDGVNFSMVVHRVDASLPLSEQQAVVSNEDYVPVETVEATVPAEKNIEALGQQLITAFSRAWRIEGTAEGQRVSFNSSLSVTTAYEALAVALSSNNSLPSLEEILNLLQTALGRLGIKVTVNRWADGSLENFSFVIPSSGVGTAQQQVAVENFIVALLSRDAMVIEPYGVGSKIHFEITPRIIETYAHLVALFNLRIPQLPVVLGSQQIKEIQGILAVFHVPIVIDNDASFTLTTALLPSQAAQILGNFNAAMTTKMSSRRSLSIINCTTLAALSLGAALVSSKFNLKMDYLLNAYLAYFFAFHVTAAFALLLNPQKLKDDYSKIDLDIIKTLLAIVPVAVFYLLFPPGAVYLQYKYSFQSSNAVLEYLNDHLSVSGGSRITLDQLVPSKVSENDFADIERTVRFTLTAMGIKFTVLPPETALDQVVYLVEDRDDVLKSKIIEKVKQMHGSGKNNGEGPALDLIPRADHAALATNSNQSSYGGIDFDSAQLSLQIKRDGHGVPLPISQQDVDSIHLKGLIPVILSIRSAAESPVLSEYAVH